MSITNEMALSRGGEELNSSVTGRKFSNKEIIQKEREKVASSFSGVSGSTTSTINEGIACNEMDLEYLMKTVRAIITVNTDIWVRCKERAHSPPRVTVRGGIEMKTRCFDKVSLIALTQQVCGSTKIDISSKLTWSSCDFGVLPKLPACLTDICPMYDTDAINVLQPDRYEEYFKKSLILSDDVLVGFLATLQKHLEDVQVFLGRIETWLLERTSNLDYLNDLFGTNVKTENIMEGEMKIAEGRRKKMKKRGPYSNRSPQSPFLDSSSDNIPPKLFFSIASKANDQFNLKFDLRTQKGRERLEAMVSFVKIAQSED